ncbi:MAG TPA: bifunctional UDP-sugar hydrolase/5'-nucleotidase, partial [Chthoniobacterales bacterium]
AISNSDFVQISILHTTDVHGHILPTSDYAGNADLGGFARCVTQIKRWRRQNRNSILIDVGDVYQGTDVSLRTNGALMIDLFNHLKFDAWIIGNHEFDWGVETFTNAVTNSHMPVLAANMSINGKPSGEISDSPLGKIQPYLLKEIDGIRIAIIGITTPGMPFWFRPEFIRGFDFHYSVEPVRRAINRAKREGADAIVLAGHMGLKPRSGGDDFANNVIALTTEFPEVATFIAGHTHQSIPSRTTNGVLLTQADHFGIHVGRLDLTFDRASKKLLRREAHCELMDNRIPLDRVTISRAKPQLEESVQALAEPVGALAETLRVRRQPSEPGEVEALIGTAIIESLRDRGVAVDGAMHGIFDERNDFMAGPKTVNDIWTLIPFENFLVTAELTPEEIKTVMEEVYASREPRTLIGFQIRSEGTGQNRRIVSIQTADGQPLAREQHYAIAFNTFDSRSGGHRFMKLRSLLETPVTRCTFHPVQTRDALIDFFRRHQTVRKIDILGRRSLGEGGGLEERSAAALIAK